MGRRCSHRWVDPVFSSPEACSHPKPPRALACINSAEGDYKACVTCRSRVLSGDGTVNEQRGELQRYGVTEEGHGAEPPSPVPPPLPPPIQTDWQALPDTRPIPGLRAAAWWARERERLRGSPGLADPRPEKN
ncbi:unnamed protein product [Boreogadus saida]